MFLQKKKNFSNFFEKLFFQNLKKTISGFSKKSQGINWTGVPHSSQFFSTAIRATSEVAAVCCTHFIFEGQKRNEV